MCEHDQEMCATYNGLTFACHCGNFAPHAPHDECLGIMCDYGCNAEDF